jgi:hypothetical protein
MNELSGLGATFPPNDLGLPLTPLAQRAADVCALVALLLDGMGHTWEAYNFRQVDADGVCFNVRYPSEDGGIWVTTGGLMFDGGSDAALAHSLAAWWDREFRGVNPPGKKNG